jgi:hypothetical protein
MRYQSPAREHLSPATFAHPAFSPFSDYSAWLTNAEWPSIGTLNERWRDQAHTVSQKILRFVAQADAKKDGSHFEARTFETGAIATREACWHDLFNVLMWLEFTALKCALNTAYVRDFAQRNAEPRTRAQCAITHFDEGGAIVVLRDARLLTLWDQHAWRELFVTQRESWDRAASVYLVGHALLDHLLTPRATPTAKCVVVLDENQTEHSGLINYLAQQIIAGELMRDPQELRPLPLAALHGWHPDNREVSFYTTAPTFRPLRPGRHYPSALTI